MDIGLPKPVLESVLGRAGVTDAMRLPRADAGTGIAEVFARHELNSCSSNDIAQAEAAGPVP
ncbi:hypothetical protein JQ559_05785 [Bradyrhizobium viridifuturi]|jgi:hypothetical protein|nr:MULTISPECIES: hypothetical protein [Bradyrhizobium]QRI71238.1 hypothetical protein JQ507_07020 [Bradyrhizobium sp. PSBB068]MBR1020173.1 hypothetical protein [Bradyrhizobium viridifuturi]MBR1036540.1 hypothetical protein [Bradyrhizobium viridifuturi]MBR1043149.1 hypothetical protein [Bradyrhizobium viridifuturi]MBR1071820.1 hypothetical protein [Bradyrhizobium viridifuturi]